MTWLWVLLGVFVVILLLVRLFTWYFGHWRMSVNRVIAQFSAISKDHPDEDIDIWSMRLLDLRYPKDGLPTQAAMHQRINIIDNYLNTEVFNRRSRSPIYDILIQDTLPTLILKCLMIEGHRVVRSNAHVLRLYPYIVNEVKRQGYSEFCEDNYD